MTTKLTIEIHRERGPGLPLVFDQVPVTIGASPSCDVVLDHPFVSSDHAIVTLSRGGVLFADRSKNGSFVDGKRIQTHWFPCTGSVFIPPFRLDIRIDLDEDEQRHTQFFPHREGDLAVSGPVSVPAAEVSSVDATVVRTGARASAPAANGASTGITRPPTPETGARRCETSFTVPPVPPAALAPTSSPVGPPPPAPPPAILPKAASSPIPSRRAPSPPPFAPRERPEEGEVNSRRFHLAVLEGPPGLAGKSYPLGKEPLQIGRDVAATVHLDLPTISRRHAVLAPDGHGGWILRDLQSANGTTVADRLITEVVLGPGDQFSVGKTVVFRIEAERPAGAEEDSRYLLPVRLSGRRAGTAGTVTVVEVAGRLDVVTYAELPNALSRAADSGRLLVVLVMADVIFIDHAGMGALVQLANRVSQTEGQMVLARLRPKIRQAFSLSRLDALFRNRIFDTEEEAVAYLERHGSRS